MVCFTKLEVMLHHNHNFILQIVSNHFLSGSLYFYAKPNYDSIYPAAEYLKKDIKRIMESLEWKNN